MATAETLPTWPKPRDYRHGQGRETTDMATAERLPTWPKPGDYRHGHGRETTEMAMAERLPGGMLARHHQGKEGRGGATHQPSTTGG